MCTGEYKDRRVYIYSVLHFGVQGHHIHFDVMKTAFHRYMSTLIDVRMAWPGISRNVYLSIFMPHNHLHQITVRNHKTSYRFDLFYDLYYAQTQTNQSGRLCTCNPFPLEVMQRPLNSVGSEHSHWSYVARNFVLVVPGPKCSYRLWHPQSCVDGTDRSRRRLSDCALRVIVGEEFISFDHHVRRQYGTGADWFNFALWCTSFLVYSASNFQPCAACLHCRDISNFSSNAAIDYQVWSRRHCRSGQYGTGVTSESTLSPRRYRVTWVVGEVTVSGQPLLSFD